MSSEAATRRLLRSSPYWPVLSHPQLGRILPGLTVSALGDGMSVVAVSWLALHLAPAAQRGTWVAVAVAAYTLPGAAGTFIFRRLMSGRSGAQLAGWNAILRAVALGTIPVAYALGALSLGLYVVLLGASSLLASWGAAGRYTLIAELLPGRHHLAANAVMTTIAEAAVTVGPPLAGFIISQSNAAVVIAIDAVTFAVLAVTYRLATPTGTTVAAAGDRPPTVGFQVIWHDRTLLALLTLTFGFFFLFGPVAVALPVHVADDLHASATVLGAYYAVFGVGAVIGGLATGYLRRLRLWPITIGIVVGFGLVMLPFGLGAPVGVTLVAFALAGMIWAPYMSTSMALFQRSASPAQLASVLAANGAVTVLAVPLGSLLGGVLVTAHGARVTLLSCAIAMVTFGVCAATALAINWRRPHISD